MATQTAPPDQTQAQPQQPPSDHALIAALTLIFLSGLPFVPMAAMVSSLLAGVGITGEVAEIVVALIQPRLHMPATKVAGPAQGFADRTAPAYTAAYALNAARRLQEGGTVDQERLYLQAHLAARAGRLTAAKQVDTASAQHGRLLGWYARLDSHTTVDCRAASGHNFSAGTPTAIGFPGSAHPSCRCMPGPPFLNAGSVDDAVRALPAGTV